MEFLGKVEAPPRDAIFGQGNPRLSISEVGEGLPEYSHG
jgi:hypothetical protein